VAASQFRTEQDDGRTIVYLTGEIDLAVKKELAHVLDPLLGSVVVDFTDVTFLDSSAIGVLAVTHTRLGAIGGDLRLRAPGDLIRRTLKVVGLGDWIDD
jgi:anti-anti-sigma factor